eukprot:scaffold426750_cov71-Attheya_sp.AAC.1
MRWTAPMHKAALILTKAHFELEGISLRIHVTKPTCLVVKCAHCVTFNLHWIQKQNSTVMKVKSHSDHDSNCGRNIGDKKVRSMNYLHKDIIPLVLPSYIKCRKSGKTISSDNIRDILKPYVFDSGSISPRMCTKIRNEAEDASFGNIASQGQLMDKVVAECLSKGHSCVTHHVTKARQQEILLANRKAEHNSAMKNVLKANKIKFPGLSEGDKDLMSSLRHDDKILYGWDFSPRWAKLIFPKLRKLYYADGAHMKTALHGTLFGLWGIDANDQLVCLALSLYYDNEGEDTWNRFLRFVKNVYPQFDNSEATIIADGEKGFAKMLLEVFPNVNKFLCCQHEKAHLSKDDRKVYMEAVKTTTLNQLASVKERFSSTAFERWKDCPDKQLFPVATNGKMYFRSASTLAEVGNKTLEGVRKHGPAQALLVFIEQDAIRISSHQKHANASKDEELITPHAGYDHLREMKKKRDGFDDPIVKIDTLWASVSTQLTPYKTYLTKVKNLGGRHGDCSCGKPKQQIKPCWHEVTTVEKMDGVPPNIKGRVQFGNEIHLFGECYSVKVWKEQYKNLGSVSPLATSEVEEHKLTANPTKIPTFGKRPKGRPSEKKRKKGMIDFYSQHSKQIKNERQLASQNTSLTQCVDV